MRMSGIILSLTQLRAKAVKERLFNLPMTAALGLKLGCRVGVLLLAWAGQAHSEVVLDNTAQGTEVLTRSGAPMNIAMSYRCGLVFQVGSQRDLTLNQVRLGLGKGGDNDAFYLSLYEVDTNNNPVGSPIAQHTLYGGPPYNPAYLTFTLTTNGWNALRNRRYFLQVQCWGTGAVWATADPPQPPTSGPWASFVGYRRASVAGWETNYGAIQIDAVPYLDPRSEIALYVNGVGVSNQAPSQSRGPALVELRSPFAGGLILYTLDGADPSSRGLLYPGPFSVMRTATLRATAYSADLLLSVALDPTSIDILPLLSVAAAGGGSIGVEPASGPYAPGSLATVTATPSPGWTFLQWLGDADGTNPVVTVSMNRSKSVRAVFGTSVTTSAIGNGTISLHPQAQLYPYGQTVRFTAQPANGSYFVSWGGSLSGANSPITLNLTNSNPAISAAFAALTAGKYALTLLSDGNGSVTGSPYATRYNSGQTVSLTATPDAGQNFLGWAGDASGTANPISVAMNTSKTISASFTKRPTLSLPPGLAGWFADGFRLLLTGEFGVAYQLLGSTNLTDWLPLSSVTNQFGTAQLMDDGATNSPTRFYRLIQVP
jgi:hypothetical protein